MDIIIIMTAQGVAKATYENYILAIVLPNIQHRQWSMPVSGVTPFYIHICVKLPKWFILWGQGVVAKILLLCLLQELYRGHLGVCYNYEDFSKELYIVGGLLYMDQH